MTTGGLEVAIGQAEASGTYRSQKLGRHSKLMPRIGTWSSTDVFDSNVAMAKLCVNMS